jgi:hypothetical protein
MRPRSRAQQRRPRAVAPAVALALAALEVGCRSEREAAPRETTLTAARLDLVPNDVAIERLVQARCVHENACSNVGLERTYVTQEGCLRKVRTAAAVELDPGTTCPLGMERNKLEACVAAAAAESCSDPVATLARVEACRGSELCPRSNRP